jgi:uncharacterized NAD-dependent epimerase/dehydratase family protein
MRDIRGPYLLYLGDANREFGAKTAQGILHWRPELCVGQFRLPACEIDLGLADLDFAAAHAAGARTVVLGVAARGGQLPDHWVPHLEKALTAGLDIASGQHRRLTDIPALVALAQRHGRQLHDVRHWPGGEMPLATGERRMGRRVLAIGTDCAVGKKFTALALHQSLVERGVAATFRATGQTGVLISGAGVALDAIPGDFIAGVAEALSPANAADHWDVIEGQATVLHPTFAAVTTGLVHGSQPDAMVLCHEAGRTQMRGLAGRALPSIADTIAAHVACAKLNHPDPRVVAISLNTAGFEEAAARDLIARLADEHGLPVTDPVRFGAGVLADAVLALA